MRRRFVLVSIVLLVGLTACNTAENKKSEDSAFDTYCSSSGNPVVSEALEQGHLHVVAIGSSTTEGTGATSKDKNYVSRLEQRLKLAYKTISGNIEVDNYGTGGQVLSLITNRFERDVYNNKPDVVILQTGINDAIQKVNKDTFRKLLTEDVKLLKQKGYYILIIGNQYLGDNGDTRVPGLTDFNTIISEVSENSGVGYIDRYNLFKTLINQKTYPLEELYAGDLLHHSDKGYDILSFCIYRKITGETK